MTTIDFTAYQATIGRLIASIAEIVTLVVTNFTTTTLNAQTVIATGVVTCQTIDGERLGGTIEYIPNQTNITGVGPDYMKSKQIVLFQQLANTIRLAPFADFQTALLRDEMFWLDIFCDQGATVQLFDSDGAQSFPGFTSAVILPGAANGSRRLFVGRSGSPPEYYVMFG